MRSVFAVPAVIAIAGSIALGACGGSSGTPAATTAAQATTTAAAVASPARTATTTSAATPKAATPAATSRAASPVASPRAASPVASPAGAAVDLGTAFSNLVNQKSYQFVAQMQNMQGALSMVPGMTPSSTLTIESSGADRHVKVTDGSNTTLVELWRVGGTVWASAAGTPPAQATSSTPVLGQLLPLLDADKLLVTSLTGTGANYKVTGTEDVNGTPAQTETATYQVTPPSNPIIPAGTYNVNSQIWVARTGNYLVQGNMQLAQGTATPAATSPSVKINVTQVGKPITIQAPA